MQFPRQTPSTGSHIIRHRGDILSIHVSLPQDQVGKVWLRTNLGKAEVRQREIAAQIEHGQAILEHDWHDVRMRQIDAGSYSVSLPMLEVGRFQAKAFVEPEAGGEPVWAEGEDLVIKVEPAEYCCASTIYSAFVRQFGENRFHGAEQEEYVAVVNQLENSGYEVIPRSGTFRDLIEELDHIVFDLGFRIVLLLPVFPTPTTHARMGRFGSPFAALDFMDVDSALAEFDRKTTPLDQFRELVDETHRRGAKLFLDIPINHTGWASWLQNHHPEWFKRSADTTFESPGAWGVTWADLAELDYHDRRLWIYMAEVFLFWCRQGVDGYRCDAGYMVPSPVWEYITAKVRSEFPDAAFLLEGLGGDKRLVFELLDKANLNWAYSELFQNYQRPHVEAILKESIAVSNAQGVQVHFAETHDNMRLAATSENWARMRTALAALCSHSGGWGMACGVEWFAKEKIDVHRARSLNWGNTVNQVANINRLNAVLTVHPAFWHGANLAMIQRGNGNVLALRRTAVLTEEEVLVLVNLSAEEISLAAWKKNDFPVSQPLWDLLNGEQIDRFDIDSTTASVSLRPGEAMCLTNDSSFLARLGQNAAVPERSVAQRLSAKVLALHECFQPGEETNALDLGQETQALCQNARRFCNGLTGTAMPPVVSWRWPRDLHRVVMWTPGTALLIEAEHSFMVELKQRQQVLRHEQSFASNDGGHFALMLPLTPSADVMQHLTIGLTVFETESNHRDQASVLILPTTMPPVLMRAGKEAMTERALYGLCTNGRGAMSHVRALWGDIRTQYDTLLAANPHPDYPVDRRMLLARVRGWVVYRDYSREINAVCAESFSQCEDGSLQWVMFVPSGMGKHVRLEITLTLIHGKNAIWLSFRRLGADAEEDGALADAEPVKLILRPDIEDRNFHEKTKAHHGHNESWPRAVDGSKDGFVFRLPGGHGLTMTTDNGAFTAEDEWLYMVQHPIDAERGLGGASDLFSPGYFTIPLEGGQQANLHAHMPDETVEKVSIKPAPALGVLTLQEAAKRAIADFIVKRDDTRTVIAGYPWFLDWGRDTLICLRGIIAAGMLDEARDIIRQFAQFEKHGTLPNMIRGGDDSNRDTSDAPLWLFAACADLRHADGNDRFLETDCGNGKTIIEVLKSIAKGYLKGTPNGIRVDPASCLVFSPSHFTWMDTNHPAGTPRVGYPIEIQAFWHAALTLLDELDPGATWGTLRETVSESIEKFFWHPERGFLSDCLHAKAGQALSMAQADDHLRPNQLFAITLGAISDPVICRAVLSSCEELLIPGAIRSLSERRVWHRLPVERDGHLLNNPNQPYWGRYEGDEDTRRKPAYHNGTAWTWPFPSYAEALVLTYGESARETARALLFSSVELFNDGCLGHLPEVLDGDAPHTQRGCGAQAWSVTELYRVLSLLDPSQES